MSGISGYEVFELDLLKAIIDQMLPVLDAMESAPLTLINAQALPDGQGIYQISYENAVRYIGKTDGDAGLRARLLRHRKKLLHRVGISPDNVQFRAVRIPVMTAVDIETELIRHYGAQWNGSGFGSNDPGRERETTGKPAMGFDAQYPIDTAIPLDLLGAGISLGHTKISEILWKIKEYIPYTFRYETTTNKRGAYKLSPHIDYSSNTVDIVSPFMTMRQVLKLLVASLPVGWQATAFVSHAILYKETRHYKNGTVVDTV